VILAPPTVGALAVAALAGPVGPFLWALCGLSAFILALLAIGLPHTFAAGFSPAIWAFSFPLANFASLLLLLAPLAVALPALLLVSAVIALMAALTLRAWASGRLLAPLPPVATP
jgi:tellurite resistance protein